MMNLFKLYHTQEALRSRINYNESDRFDKLILGLIVEIGECANNERKSFKYWSKDQESRRIAEVNGIVTYPLLEEYVDGLHLVLDLGIEIQFDHLHLVQKSDSNDTILEQFTEVLENVMTFAKSKHQSHYRILLESYLLLGEKLGYTEAEIEEAYYQKNKINHIRQDEGY